MDIEMSFNILEMLSYFHCCYSQLLFKQYKNLQIKIPIEIFPFFGKLKKTFM